MRIEIFTRVTWDSINGIHSNSPKKKSMIEKNKERQ